MGALSDFFNHFDWMQVIVLLMSMVAALISLTVHELCHGAAAYVLGDPTAKQAGRLTLNPIAHIDPIGFLMMLIAHVGWAKAVPVDISRFKHPKRDMALIALAGPASNFLVAFLALMLGSVALSGVLPLSEGVLAWAVLFFCYMAVLSVGLGLFNLIPVPPLDGSKVLFSLLPDSVYYAYLRYERYLLLVVVALAWFGAFSGPLDVAVGWILNGMCKITQFPFAFFQYYFGL